MVEFDFEQFVQRLDNLKAELAAKPSLRQFLDADLQHNLSALRLTGIPSANDAQREETRVPTSIATKPAVISRHNSYGGHREGAGRRKIYQTRAEKERPYRKRRKQVSVCTKSSLQVSDIVG